MRPINVFKRKQVGGLLLLGAIIILMVLIISSKLKEGKEREEKLNEKVEYLDDELKSKEKENSSLKSMLKTIREDKDNIKKEMDGLITEKEKLNQEKVKLENENKKLKEKINSSKEKPSTPSRGGRVSRGSKRLLGTFEVTAYTDDVASQGKWVGKTASGMKPQVGVVAVDPRVIPLGTKLYVEGYGECVAGDTGGAIKGNIIDVFFNTSSECRSWGRKKKKVYIIE